MVNYLAREAGGLDATFGALADPTRRAILARLALGEATVTELASPFNVSLPAISKHLRVLERAGLMARRKDGRIHHCRLAPGPLQNATEWLAFYRRFWDGQLDSLAAYLASDAQSNDTTEEHRS
jgi:DNA-binding transcriptional ArsR family regulator